MSQLDKFVWLRAVYAGPFTDGQKAVLAYVAVFSVFAGRDTFCVRQATIAEQVGTTRQTVSAAVGQAKRCGYLVVSSRRESGLGRHRADELRLVLPESCKESGHESCKESRHESPSHVKKTNESCKENEPSHVKKTNESCKAANSLTSENDPPNSSIEQFSRDSSPRQGFASARASSDRLPAVPTADADAEPPVYVPEPLDHDDNRAAAADYAAMFGIGPGTTPQPIKDAANCPLCAGTNWRLDHGGRDGDNPMRCDHTTSSSKERR